MRTTITVEEELVERARELTGVTSRNDLVRRALETLVRVESAHRLAKLGGSDPSAAAAPRQRLE